MLKKTIWYFLQIAKDSADDRIYLSMVKVQGHSRLVVKIKKKEGMRENKMYFWVATV